MAESGGEQSEEIRRLIVENTTGATVGERDRSNDDQPAAVDPKYRQRRSSGRRVTLKRRNGEYIILHRNNVIQSFCIGDFERITRFSIPEGIQQEVRIEVVSLSPPREISISRDEEAPAEDGVELRTIAHPTPERLWGLRPETLEEMEIELPGVVNPWHSWQDEAIESISQDIERLRQAMEVIANLGSPR